MLRIVAELLPVVDFIFTGQLSHVHLLCIGSSMRQLGIVILSGLLICSCEPDSPEIGSDFFHDGVIDFSYIDSATLNLSTIQIKELTTSGTSRLLTGTHYDSQLGKITASPYFQLSPSGSIDLEDENVTYDYLSLVLYYDDYFYYDTLSPISLDVHRVKEDITTDKGVLYNSSTFTIYAESLGALTFKPKPHTDSIEIRLSDVLGKEIFQLAKEGSDQLTSANFQKYFKGLAVVPDTSSSGCIIGLTTNPKLKLHYTDKGTIPSQQTFSAFEVSASSNLYFTGISCDRRATNLNVPLTDKERLSSTRTDDEAYLQAGAGLALRIDLPYLRALKQLSNFYVTQAVLEIYPIRKSSDSATPLPPQLNVFKADKRNEIYNEIETPAYLLEDLDLGRSTRYTFDATEFVKEQMELQSLNENALILTSSIDTYPVAVDRVYFGAPGYEYKTRLRIYFATVNN